MENRFSSKAEIVNHPQFENAVTELHENPVKDLTQAEKEQVERFLAVHYKNTNEQIDLSFAIRAFRNRWTSSLSGILGVIALLEDQISNLIVRWDKKRFVYSVIATSNQLPVVDNNFVYL